MNDVTHPSEAEMMSIRNIFDRAANAIVQASELAKQVAELEGKFASLTRDFETMLSRNNELVQSLQEVRGQRDTAMAERDQAKAKILDLEENVEHNNSVVMEQIKTIHALEAKLASMTLDRDNAVDEWHRADTGKATAEAKLHNIQKALGLPEATPTPVVEPKPEPTTEGGIETEVAHPKEPESTATKHEWDTPYHPNRF